LTNTCRTFWGFKTAYPTSGDLLGADTTIQASFGAAVGVSVTIVAGADVFLMAGAEVYRKGSGPVVGSMVDSYGSWRRKSAALSQSISRPIFGCGLVDISGCGK